MAVLAQKKLMWAGFSNEDEIKKARYNYDQDKGAIGVYEIFEAKQDMIVSEFSAVVKKAVTSGGAGTVKLGVTGDDDAFAQPAALANLTAGAVFIPLAVTGTPDVLPEPVPVKAGDKILMTIGTAALTAGEIEFTVRYRYA